MDNGHREDEERDEESRDPGAFNEFGDQDDDGGDAGGGCAEAVDGHAKF